MSDAFAFPRQTDPDGRPTYGLSKRELFAALAMQGWLASYGPELPFPDGAALPRLASNCVAAADALILALKEIA